MPDKLLQFVSIEVAILLTLITGLSLPCNTPGLNGDVLGLLCLSGTGVIIAGQSSTSNGHPFNVLEG